MVLGRRCAHHDIIHALQCLSHSQLRNGSAWAECTRASQEYLQRNRPVATRQNSTDRWPQYRPCARRPRPPHLLGSWWCEEFAFFVGKVCVCYSASWLGCRLPWLACPTLTACYYARYYGEAHGLLYVVDAADSARIDESRDVLQQLLNTAELAGIPLLVILHTSPHHAACSYTRAPRRRCTAYTDRTLIRGCVRTAGFCQQAGHCGCHNAARSAGALRATAHRGSAGCFGRLESAAK